MIVSKYKLIFVAVPKTGSQTVRSMIAKKTGGGYAKKVSTHFTLLELKRVMQDYVKDPSNFNGHLLTNPTRFCNVDRNSFDEYFKCGFVRNPWERTISLFNRMRGTMEFEDFVDWIQNSSDTLIEIGGDHKNQLDWFTDENGKVIADFIGRFERLKPDIKYIFKKMGILIKTKDIFKKNHTQWRKFAHYSEFYTEKTRKIIGEKFKVDIEYFNYEFEDKK